jgi:hypothetical protein
MREVNGRTPQIVPDAGNTQQSIDNTKLIEEDCNLHGQLP